MKRIVAVLCLAMGGLALACGSAEEDDSDVGLEGPEDMPLTAAERAEAERVCDLIQPPRPWTRAESEKLLTESARRFNELKRENDALIARRGVGRFAGAKSAVYKAKLENNRRRMKDLIRPHLKAGFDLDAVVDEVEGTSCIGVVYRILSAVYKDLGREQEWKTIEACGRKWGSDGLHVQQALIKNGWPSPTMGFVTDANRLPGNNDADRSQHRDFVNAAARGSYFGTPVSQAKMMKNFFPTPGSSTRVDESVFLEVGKMNTIAMSTMRGAYHVPLIVPAHVIPEDLAPSGSARNEWVRARDRGEPFILESHSTREPWDATNFEVRSLKATIAETMGSSVTYGTGTLLFAPVLESPLSGE